MNYMRKLKMKVYSIKIVWWEVIPDSGTIEYNVKDPLIGYMPQELNKKAFDRSETIIDYLENITWVRKFWARIEEIYTKMSSESYDDSILDDLWDTQSQYEKLWGYEFDNIVDKVLDWLKVEWISKTSKLISLSWWQKSKILLAWSLLTWWDILLLDEPTNNLDIRSIEWLIDYVKSKLVTILIVSHDKHFLNEVTNKMLELSLEGAQVYSGNYDFYKHEKELLLNRENFEYTQYVEKLDELKRKLNDLQSKRSSTSKVKRIKDNNKAAANKAREKAQNTSWSEIKKLKQQMEVLEKNKPHFNKPKRELKFSLSLSEKVHWWITVENVDFKYPNSDNWIKVENFSINSWEKVAILWNNWAWKSTLIKLINWGVEPQSWKVSISPSIVIWNYLQEHQLLDPEKTVFNFLSDQLDWVDESHINSVLARFNFNKEDREKKIWILSPWQRSRMLLSYFTIKKCNTLIFDEPTNHLDLEWVEQLELTLKEFNWNLIVISHDRDFIENIGFDSFYKVEKWVLEDINWLEDYFVK